MRAIDKLRRDLDATMRRESGSTATTRTEALRRFFLGEFRGVPEEVLASLFSSFLERREGDEEGALAWLAGVSSILLMDYDDTEFSPADWLDIKESIILGEDDMDLELLSYAMSLVLDHGAL